MGTAVPNRIFSPHQYVKKATRQIDLPSDLLVSNHKAAISNLVLYDGRTATKVKGSVAITIDGARRGHGKHAQASYGAWFLRDSELNKKGFIAKSGEQSYQHGEIIAAMTALEIVGERMKNVKLVVLLTDSHELVQAICNDIFLWTWHWSNEFRNEYNKAVQNGNALKDLNDSINSLALLGVKVKFWEVDSEHVKCARTLALSVFTDGRKGEIRDHGDIDSPGYKYWINKANNSTEVWQLAQEMNLDIPDRGTQGAKAELMYPVRRLVLTGNDSKRKFKLFFGTNEDDRLLEVWEMARRSVLRSQIQNDGGKDKWYDYEVPSWAWKPRRATAKEQSDVDKHIAHMKD